jgi:maleate isomerase
VDDNLALGRLDQGQVPDLARRIDTRGADAVVLSACVQRPLLEAIAAAAVVDLPVITAATATSRQVLSVLGAHAPVPESGAVSRG